MRKFFGGLLVGLLVLFGALTPASPAQAALSDCTAYANVVCLWKNAAAGGPIWRQTTLQIPTTSCRPLTEAGWNDTVTTIRLQSTQGWVLQVYSNGSCAATPVEIYENITYDFTGNPWNNTFSSLKLRVA